MSNPSGWLFLAEEDLKTAKAVLKEDIPSMAAFHAQQATEKSLKGYLISQEKRIRKTHDLSALLEETGLEDFKQECRFLNKFYAATRYPDIIPGSLEDALPTTEQAKQAVEHAEEIFSFIKDKITVMQKGFAVPLIILGTVVLTVAATGAFYLGLQASKPQLYPFVIQQEGQNSAITSQAVQPSVSPQPTPTPDETSNWKVYKNVKYKFELKYPENWYYVDDSNVKDVRVVFFLVGTKADPTEGEREGNEVFSLAAYESQYPFDYYRDNLPEKPDELIVNNKSAIRTGSKQAGRWNIMLALDTSKNLIVSLTYKKEAQAYIDQILNAFKSLE